MQKVSTCLSEVELNDYLTGALPDKKRLDAESHLKDCEVCLDKMVFAYQTVNEFGGTKTQGVEFMKSPWKRNIWILGATVTFILSFVVSRFFLQFLVATVILASKWIFDSVNARILIMIYEAWKKGGEREASKILGRLNNR